LEIATTANQDPLAVTGLVPVLGIDVWEHGEPLNFRLMADFSVLFAVQECSSGLLGASPIFCLKSQPRFVEGDLEGCELDQC
jgi:hypothetical protein